MDSNDNILVATESGTYRSTNHGSSWNLTGGGSAQYLLVDNQNNIFVAGDGFINRSQDGGQS